jgi:hypothetical protein
MRRIVHRHDCGHGQSRQKLFALTTNARLSRYVTAKNANRADARAWPPGTESIIRATGYKAVHHGRATIDSQTTQASSPAFGRSLGLLGLVEVVPPCAE